MSDPANLQIFPNAVWYVVSKPKPVLDANGQPMMEVVGVAQDLASALNAAAPFPGSVVIMNTCLHINPPKAIAPAKPLPKSN